MVVFLVGYLWFLQSSHVSHTVLKEDRPPAFPVRSGGIPSLCFYFPSTMTVSPCYVTFVVFGEGHYGVHSWREQEEGLSMVRMWGGLSLSAKETCGLSLVFSPEVEVQDRVCWRALFIPWTPHRLHHPTLSPPASVLNWRLKASVSGNPVLGVGD